jgi:heavy metal translocating P-type ATPase
VGISLCSHCGLPVAGAGLQGEVQGAWQRFCCYGCFLCQKIIGEKGESGLSSWLLAQLGLSWFLAMDIMMISLIRYTGGFEGVDPATIRAFEWIEFFLMIPIVLLLGVPYLYRSLRSLLRGSINADVLIAIGTVFTFGYSTHQLFTRENPHLYFDSGSMILVLVVLGRYLEAAARRKSSEGLRTLSAADLADARRLLPDGSSETVSAEHLRPGDRIRVGPGEGLAADGVVEEGTSSIPEALLTGEERPVPKAAGDRVFAGTVNGDAPLVVRVTEVGEDTLRARICELTREALARRTRFESIVDSISRVFVPVVIALACATWWYWSRTLAPEEAVIVALSVLVVACPCALGLAVPMASALALARGAELGLLFRDGSVLEKLARVHTVLLDKTGTLTRGRPELADSRPAAGFSPDSLLALAASAESASEHSLGKALVSAALARGLELAPATGFRAFPGEGIEATVQGRLVRVGQAAFCGLAPEPEPETGSRVHVSVDGTSAGSLDLGDSLKEGAREAVKALHELGLGVWLVTGDAEPPARRVAAETGITKVRSRQTPQDKLAVVREAGGERVAMTGDGFNDGPALMEAGVGISFREATGLARLSAGVTLLGEDLRKLPLSVRLARRTLSVMRLNLFWAFVYNVGALGLAAAGKVGPGTAALAMLVSSLSVVGNSWRLRNFERNVSAPEGRAAQP